MPNLAPAQANNLGVLALQHNDLTGAKQLFRQALGDLQTHITFNARGKRSLSPQQDSVYSIPCIRNTIGLPLGGAFKRYDTASIFSRAIPLPICSCQLFHEESEFDDSTFSAIIIFNLGLVFHLEGIQDMSLQAQLVKAKNLYLHAHNLLERSAAVMQDGFSPHPGLTRGTAVIDLLYMGLLNNLAQIYSEFCDSENSRNFFILLVRHAMSLQLRDYGMDESKLELASFMDQQIESFLNNAMFSVLTSHSASAAA